MRKAYLLIIIPILILGGMAVFRYQPPFPDRGGRNPLERLFDHLAFTWYFTKATWRDGRVDQQRALLDFARASWHRPSFSGEAFNLSPSDYSGLALQFESLGLNEEAVILFEAAYRKDPGKEQARESILGCLGLGSWERAARIAADCVLRRPDAWEGYYWWGRALLGENHPEDAVEKLKKAAGIAPGKGDIFYRLGECYQTLERDLQAQVEYEKAVSTSPAHLEAWRALAELYRKAGKDRSALRAQEKASALTPSRPARARFGDELILLGFGGLPAAVRGEESFPFTIYCESLPGADGEVTPYLKLKAGRFQKRLLLEPIALSDASPGEVAVKPCRLVPPWDICPLPSEALIGFLDESGEPVRVFGSRDHELKLGEVVVEPGLFSCPRSEPRLAEAFGKDVIDLRKRTVLAGGEEVEVKVGGSVPVVALGLVSHTEGTITTPQGTETASVECLGADGARFEYPVRLGLETADRWLESRDPRVPRHKPARTFYSHKAEGEKNYSWHYYRALFPLAEPTRLESLKLKYTYPNGGCWVVRNIFLLETPPSTD